jgi:adenylate cyclase
MAKGTQRRLTTIVAADIAGFSRLVGNDEEGTLSAQRSYRAELIEPLLAEHHGRIANTAGDSFLFEFPSAVEAVRCSVAVQEGMAERNRDIPGERRIEYRIGINVGDVVAQGDDLLGDGVNIAARLENICEAGGIILSDDAHRQIRDRLEITWEDGGEHEVKNIARPVQVWRWSMSVPQSVSVASEDVETLALPDKPSIAVLPFDNMSNDPDQEYFSDGMTEDIITALSRLRWLFVIARNSTFTYKGQAVDVKRVGREMGVRYVLEGSVRKAGQRVRVTAQLIEAETGNHIWAERYDRELADIFDLQDELTEAISAQVNTELSEIERQQAHKKVGTDLNAWDLFQRGMWHFYKFRKDDMAEAGRLFQLACDQAPDFANAHAGIAFVAFNSIIFGFTQDQASILEQGLREAEKAVELDERDSFNHAALGRMSIVSRNGERAIAAFEKSIELNPSSAQAYHGLGFALVWFGRAAEAIPVYARAFRMSPHDPQQWSFLNMRAVAHWQVDNYDQTIADAKSAIQIKNDEFWPYLQLAVAYTKLGKDEEAHVAYGQAVKLNPKLSAVDLKSMIGSQHPPYLEKYLDALRKAGLPEE